MELTGSIFSCQYLEGVEYDTLVKADLCEELRLPLIRKPSVEGFEPLPQLLPA